MNHNSLNIFFLYKYLNIKNQCNNDNTNLHNIIVAEVYNVEHCDFCSFLLFSKHQLKAPISCQAALTGFEVLMLERLLSKQILALRPL